MRDPICLGTYYGTSKELLLEEIDAIYIHPRGPGKIVATEKKDIQAIIAPNSPYAHSGACAAFAYKRIAQAPLPNLYIILSGDHHTTKSALTLEAYKTPIGLVKTDEEFVKALAKKGNIGIDDEIHSTDHGIEVQLPLLQHAKYSECENICIAPIIVSADIDEKKLINDIKNILLEQQKHAIIIVSSNLLRHGPLFHFTTYFANVQENIRAFDKIALKYLHDQDTAAWKKLLLESGAPIDGAVAINILLGLIEKSAAKTLSYYTSTDILNEQRNSMSYAAIVFEKA